MAAPKVLIGVITSKANDHAMHDFLDSLGKFSYSAAKAMFYDCSNDEAHMNHILAHNFNVVSPKEDKKLTKEEKKFKAKELLSAFAIEHNYDYLLLLDSNMIIPFDSIERLLRHKKDIVAGIYQSKFIVGKKIRIGPLVILPDKNGKGRFASTNELRDNELIEVDAAGLGCCLISKKALQKIKFRLDKNIKRDDFAFFLDAKSAGFKAYADTSVKCQPMFFPHGDARNQFFRFGMPMMGYKTSYEIK